MLILNGHCFCAEPTQPGCKQDSITPLGYYNKYEFTVEANYSLTDEGHTHTYTYGAALSTFCTKTEDNCFFHSFVVSVFHLPAIWWRAKGHPQGKQRSFGMSVQSHCIRTMHYYTVKRGDRLLCVCIPIVILGWCYGTAVWLDVALLHHAKWDGLLADCMALCSCSNMPHFIHPLMSSLVCAASERPSSPPSVLDRKVRVPNPFPFV